MPSKRTIPTAINKTIDKIHFDIDTEIAEAFAFAESSSFPDQKEAYEGVFLSE